MCVYAAVLRLAPLTFDVRAGRILRTCTRTHARRSNAWEWETNRVKRWEDGERAYVALVRGSDSPFPILCSPPFLVPNSNVWCAVWLTLIYSVRTPRLPSRSAGVRKQVRERLPTLFRWERADCSSRATSPVHRMRGHSSRITASVEISVRLRKIG